MFTYEPLIYILDLISFVLDIVGSVVIIYGGGRAVYQFVSTEFSKEKAKNKKHMREDLRVEFGQRIVLGLEFFIAGDVIRTIITPTWEGLSTLIVIVAIRTVLSYFLTKEIKK